MFGSRIYAAVPPRLPGMTGSALGFGTAIAATVLDKVLDAAFGVGSRPLLGLALLAAVALGVGSVTTVVGALACAAQCWGMYSGFVLHGFGELRLDPSSRFGLLLLVVLGVGASLLGLALGVALDRYRTRVVTSALPAGAAGDQSRRSVLVGGRTFRG
jgi:hypothetical protein